MANRSNLYLALRVKIWWTINTGTKGLNICWSKIWSTCQKITMTSKYYLMTLSNWWRFSHIWRSKILKTFRVLRTLSKIWIRRGHLRSKGGERRVVRLNHSYKLRESSMSKFLSPSFSYKSWKIKVKQLQAHPKQHKELPLKNQSQEMHPKNLTFTPAWMTSKKI